MNGLQLSSFFFFDIGYVRAAFIHSTYRKAMKIRNLETSIGEIINLESNDAFRVSLALRFCHTMWSFGILSASMFLSFHNTFCLVLFCFLPLLFCFLPLFCLLHFIFCFSFFLLLASSSLLLLAASASACASASSSFPFCSSSFQLSFSQGNVVRCFELIHRFYHQ